jgi:hypothetical protein
LAYSSFFDASRFAPTPKAIIMQTFGHKTIPVPEGISERTEGELLFCGKRMINSPETLSS